MVAGGTLRFSLSMLESADWLIPTFRANSG
jgi:hypothetical protein